MLNKVYCTEDESGHWYIIPLELKGVFQNYMNALEHDYDDGLNDNFEKQFSKYKTGGDLNNIQLYAEL